MSADGREETNMKCRWPKGEREVEGAKDGVSARSLGGEFNRWPLGAWIGDAVAYL